MLKRNSTIIFIESPGATTPIPWVNNAPDFSGFTEPTLSVLQGSWQAFLDSGQELEVFPDPEPIAEIFAPNWDNFNAYMLTDAMFKSYRDTVRPLDGDLTSALFTAYNRVASDGVSAFSLVWGQWILISNITTEDRNTLANIAQSCNLPSDFINLIRGN